MVRKARMSIMPVDAEVLAADGGLRPVDAGPGEGRGVLTRRVGKRFAWFWRAAPFNKHWGRVIWLQDTAQEEVSGVCGAARGLAASDQL